MSAKLLWSTLAVLFVALTATSAHAQFTGPSVTGRDSTAAAIANARVGSYVTLTGNIVTHLREEYFTFRDASGEVRVEIDEKLWQGRKVGPETRVRLVGEVERSIKGRYVDVKSLEVLN